MKFTSNHIAVLIDMQIKNFKRSLMSATKQRCIDELFNSGYVTNTNDDWYSITTHGLNLLVHLNEAAEDHSQATG